MLGYLINPRVENGRINMLISFDGKKLNMEIDKLPEFVNYYKQLYQSSSPPEIEVRNFLDKLNIKKNLLNCCYLRHLR